MERNEFVEHIKMHWTNLDYCRKITRGIWGNNEKRMKDRVRVGGGFSVFTSKFCYLFHFYAFTCWALSLVFHLSLLLCLYCCSPSSFIRKFNTKQTKPCEFWTIQNVLVFNETCQSVVWVTCILVVCLRKYNCIFIF